MLWMILGAAGGPAGIVIAYLGSKLGKASVKWIVIAVGLLVAAAALTGFVVHYQHLERDRAAYEALLAEVDGVRAKYGCQQEANPADRGLAACINAKTAQAASARAATLAHQATVAAQAEADLSAQTAKVDATQRALSGFITGNAKEDGRLPRIVLDYWARERAERGVK